MTHRLESQRLTILSCRRDPRTHPYSSKGSLSGPQPTSSPKKSDPATPNRKKKKTVRASPPSACTRERPRRRIWRTWTKPSKSSPRRCSRWRASSRAPPLQASTGRAGTPSRCCTSATPKMSEMVQKRATKPGKSGTNAPTTRGSQIAQSRFSRRLETNLRQVRTLAGCLRTNTCRSS